MTTLQGAIVRLNDAERFRELAARCHIAVTDASQPWVLIDVAPQLGKLGPPPFAALLSRELDTSVLAFFLQTTVSNERVEHWQGGQLVRALEYYFDGGGWISREGEPQDWEAAYFFAEDEGTGEGERWPFNLGDEVSDDDVLRYNAARLARCAGPVMDLLMGGDIWRLCAFHGVDPTRPGAHYQTPPNWRVLGWALLILALLVAAVVLGRMAR